MAQFVGYHRDHNSGEKPLPVATGETKDECMRSAIKRVLGSGIGTGEIAVQARDDLDTDLFVQLGATLDKYFAEKGLS